MLLNVTLIPAGADTPAGIAGVISNGPANVSVFLEASTDLGHSDIWAVIATIPLDAAGAATFGTPDPIPDPESIGATQNFYRLRVP